MAETSSIEWTDATWNPVTGCTVMTAGCARCYAMTLAGGRLQHDPTRRGLTVPTSAGPVWTGEVRFNAAHLADPLHWGRARRVFVCAHGDLFHESVPDAWIDQAFAVMALRPDHVFQLLTKRAARMRAYLSDPRTPERIGALLAGVSGAGNRAAGFARWTEGQRLAMALERLAAWPLPNVWPGVSAEDQENADFRVPDLLASPAAVRWVSAEPLLGPIDFLAIPHPLVMASAGPIGPVSALHRITTYRDGARTVSRVDWVVVGGESGPRARPMHPDWARQIRDACALPGIPFFFKQWGAWAPCETDDGDWPICSVDEGFVRLRGDGAFGVNGWPMQRVGKKHAGRLLDGREWSEQPRTAEALAA